MLFSTDDLAFEYPHFYSEDAVGSGGLIGGVIDISAQRVQRHTAFAIPLGACDFRATQSSANLHLDALGTLAHGILHHTLHGAAEHHSTLQLLCHVLCNQLGVQVRLADLFDIDVHRYTHFLGEHLAQLVHILTFLADDNTGSGCVNSDTRSLGRALDNNTADRRVLKFLLNELARC